MPRLALAKPEPRKRTKARKRREEAAVIHVVRARVALRDGYCRLGGIQGAGPCEGPSEWAHLPEAARWRTRGMSPERRHTTAGTVMVCRRHHNETDGRAYPRVTWEAKTDLGADGTLAWRRGEVFGDA